MRSRLGIMGTGSSLVLIMPIRKGKYLLRSFNMIRWERLEINLPFTVWGKSKNHSSSVNMFPNKTPGDLKTQPGEYVGTTHSHGSVINSRSSKK